MHCILVWGFQEPLFSREAIWLTLEKAFSLSSVPLTARESLLLGTLLDWFRVDIPIDIFSNVKVFEPK